MLSGISGAKEIFYNASSNGIAVTIYVNRNWYYLHKEEKKDFIKRTVVLWIGKLRGTRLMLSWHEFTPDISFINEMSGRTVATWKKSWGPSIKE